MAGPSVTYTFSNNTTADANQVNQNFQDLIDGATDGSKDYIINALTCNGAVALNGNVALGNGTPDDITINGSLSSSIPVKTTFSYDIGTSTIGIKSIYFGSNDSAARTLRMIAPAVSSSFTYTLPTPPTVSRNVRMNPSGTMSSDGPYLSNIGIATSVGSNALTISLKGADGNDPSTTNPVEIAFRSATSATGTMTVVAATAATSVVVSSGSTLGTVSGQAGYLYVYALNNAGTIELAVSGRTLFDEGSTQSTTAEGGAGGADYAHILYSTSARSGVAIKCIGRILISEATAGTWASNATEISIDFDRRPHYFVADYAVVAGRVTGAAPTNVGEYRSYLRNANAATYTETNGDPANAPTSADGFSGYRPTKWDTASTAHKPTRYEIFVGKNKKIEWMSFSSAGRTGFADTTPGIYNTTTAVGYLKHYDPVNGLAVISSPIDSAFTSTGYAFWDSTGDLSGNDFYFDIIVYER